MTQYNNTAATPRAPKKRRPSVGVKWHLFLWLTVLTAAIVLLLWLCQVVFLDDIYKAIKIAEIKSSASAIESSLESEDFEQTAANLAYKNELCILVLQMINDDRAIELYSEDNLKSCTIHNTDENSKFLLYDSAVQSGGTLMQRFRYSTENHVYVSKDSALYDTLPEENESIVYTLVTETPSGSRVLVLLNSVISPVTATVRTLNTLLSVISMVLIVLALIFALLISRMISKPITKLSGDAKRLAKGDYSVDFEASGFREIGELAQSLDYARDELSKVDELRRELIANISHDLRTPLTMISGYAEVMRDIPGEDTPENLQVIIDESNRLNSLVNDVLDISKLESGVRSVAPERFDLTETIGAALLRYNKLTERNGYKIEFEYDGHIFVETDKTILMQVFYNLVNNAVTYTGEDKRVYVRQLLVDGAVRIEVRDTGEGIAPEKLPLIWDRYYKVDKVHKRAAIGTGLGLSIVRKSMELLGGGYGVRSMPGQGSTFWFELPVTGDQV